MSGGIRMSKFELMPYAVRLEFLRDFFDGEVFEGILGDIKLILFNVEFPDGELLNYTYSIMLNILKNWAEKLQTKIVDRIKKLKEDEKFEKEIEEGELNEMLDLL